VVPARLCERIDALIWPTVAYGYYPAFIEYPAAAACCIDVRRPWCMRFAAGILDGASGTYSWLNTGISTLARSSARWRASTSKVRLTADLRRPAFCRAAEQLASKATAAMPTNWKLP